MSDPGQTLGLCLVHRFWLSRRYVRLLETRNAILEAKLAELEATRQKHEAALIALAEKLASRPQPAEEKKERERKPLSRPRPTGTEYLRRLEQEAAAAIPEAERVVTT